MKTLICAFFLSLTQQGTPTTPIVLLQNFLRSVMEARMSNTALASEYFCTTVPQRNNESGIKVRKGIDLALTMQRDLLRAQHVNASDVTIIPYDELPTSEIPPKPFHMLGDTKHVYVAQYHGKIVSYFLMSDGKIASNLLLGQGDEHYFINFCH